MTNNEYIAREAVKRARIKLRKGTKYQVYREARAIIRKEHGSSWLLILRLLWPIVMELFKR